MVELSIQGFLILNDALGILKNDYSDVRLEEDYKSKRALDLRHLKVASAPPDP